MAKGTRRKSGSKKGSKASAGSAKALDLKMGPRRVRIGKGGGEIIADLSPGSIKYNPTKIEVDCKSEGTVSFHCKPPKPTPR